MAQNEVQARAWTHNASPVEPEKRAGLQAPYSPSASLKRENDRPTIMRMGWPTWRNEYYLLPDGTLFKRMSARPSGHGKWPRLLDQVNLVAIVTRDRHRGLHIEPGPMLTPPRETEIVMVENGLSPSSSRADLGRTVPDEVKEAIAEKVRIATKRVTDRFDRFGSEAGMVDALLDRLDETVRVEGWSVRLHGQAFSSVTKEPQVGADAGWVVEIRNEGESTTKALWTQAKQVNTMPKDILTLPRLEGQMRAMREHTSAAYALIFTRAGIFLANEKTRMPLDVALTAAVNCDLGDRAPAVIATTLDLRRVARIEIDGTNA